MRREKGGRDLSVQLLRIFACFIVILVHVRPLSYTSQGYSLGRVMFSCFVSDGVAVFLIITGFFYLKNEVFATFLKKNLIKVVLPATILMVFCTIFSGFLKGEVSALESIKQFRVSELLLILQSWITGNPNLITNCGHLWYVFLHIFVVLCFPLLRRFQSDDKEVKYEKYIIMAIGFLYVVFETWSDRLQIFALADSGPYKVIPVSLLLILIGDLLYRNIDKIKGRWSVRIIGVVVYVVTNVIRTFDQLYVYNSGGTETVVFWSSAYGIICSFSLALFFLTFEIKNVFFQKCINWLAYFTFSIYLVHYVLVCTLNNYPESIKCRINDYFNGDEGSIIDYLCVVGLNALIIFVLSLGLVVIIHLIIKLCKHIWYTKVRRDNGSP